MPQHDETAHAQQIQRAPRDINHVSRAVLRSEQAKRWTKRYRTEVAASSSSLLSTFVAVCRKPIHMCIATDWRSIRSTLSRRDCRRKKLAKPAHIVLTSASYKFKSFSDCVLHTYRTEGFHGFWRGMRDASAIFILLLTPAQVFGRLSQASLSSEPSPSRYTSAPNMPSTTGYTKPRGAHHSSLPIPKAHGRHSPRLHALVWRAQVQVQPSQRSLVRHNILGKRRSWLMYGEGPFELTKLSAQISVLMADRTDGGGKNDAIRKSYQNLGTFRTAQNLIKHRGFTGLYSGFHLHLRESRSICRQFQPDRIQYETRSAQAYTL